MSFNTQVVLTFRSGRIMSKPCTDLEVDENKQIVTTDLLGYTRARFEYKFTDLVSVYLYQNGHNIYSKTFTQYE